jgi:ABC-type Fe3+/spermidine/putrescine transport system ATPase subunit
MSQAAEHYLELSELSRSFGDRVVLNAINLNVGKADLLGLLGPSGSGKTTILNIIGGFVSPDSGSVRIGGENILKLPPHRRDIGITFQNYALFPHLTVFGNVAYGLVQRKLSRPEIATRVSEMLEILSLGGYEARYPRNLSGGEQQRVALARALVVQPRLMLLDEPLANLDASLRQRVRFEIREVLRRTKVTSIFVTHDQDEAFALCDRVAILHEGRLRQVGSPADIVSEPADAFVAGFIGGPNILRAQVRQCGANNEVSVDVNGFTAAITCRSRPRQGAEIDVFIRPEEIRMEPVAHGGASNGFRVKDSVFLGGSREIWLEGPIGLRCRVALDDNRFARGAAVNVSWSPQRAWGFTTAP